MESVAKAKTVTQNKASTGHVWSVKLLIGSSNTDDSAVCYLERPVNKLVMLIESNDWLVRFPAEKPLMDPEGSPVWRVTVNIDSRLNLQVS